MDEYKHAIEAIVRPLCASEQRKNTLRRELWSHFCALREITRTETADESSAAQAALARLGSPDEIRQSFYVSIPRAERIGYRLDSISRRRGNESVGRFAGRFFLLTLIPLVALYTFIVACLELLGGDVTPARMTMVLVLVGSQAAFASVGLGGLMVRLNSIEARFRRASLAGRGMTEWARIMAIAAFAGIPLGAVIAAIGYAVLVQIGSSDTLEFLYIAPPLMGFVWLQFALVLPFGLLRGAQEANPIPDWPYEETR